MLDFRDRGNRRSNSVEIRQETRAKFVLNCIMQYLPQHYVSAVAAHIYFKIVIVLLQKSQTGFGTFAWQFKEFGLAPHIWRYQFYGISLEVDMEVLGIPGKRRYRNPSPGSWASSLGAREA